MKKRNDSGCNCTRTCRYSLLLAHLLLLDFPPLSWSVLILADVLIDQHAHTTAFPLPSPSDQLLAPPPSSSHVKDIRGGVTRPSNRHIHSAVPRLSGEELAAVSGYPCFALRSRANFTLCASPIDPKENESLVEGENGLCCSAFHIPSPVFRDECGIPRPFPSSSRFLHFPRM